jgi:hypothetical protein
MITATIITHAEIVDNIYYHVFTDKGIFLLNINNTYTFNGEQIPTFSTVEEAVNYFN